MLLALGAGRGAKLESNLKGWGIFRTEFRERKNIGNKTQKGLSACWAVCEQAWNQNDFISLKEIGGPVVAQGKQI